MYVGDFENWKDVSDNFTGQTILVKEVKPIKEPTEVIFAGYQIDGYDGAAFVVYRQGRKFFTVDGGHCSSSRQWSRQFRSFGPWTLALCPGRGAVCCYGLEGQWKPEEYTRTELIASLEKGYGGMPYSLQKYREQIIKSLKER